MTPEPDHQPPTDADVEADTPGGATPDQIALGLRMWFRRIIGAILLAALLVVVIRGIYVVWTIQQSPAP